MNRCFNPDATVYDEHCKHSKKFDYYKFVEKVPVIVPAISLPPLEQTLGNDIFERYLNNYNFLYDIKFSKHMIDSITVNILKTYRPTEREKKLRWKILIRNKRFNYFTICF